MCIVHSTLPDATTPYTERRPPDDFRYGNDARQNFFKWTKSLTSKSMGSMIKWFRRWLIGIVFGVVNSL
ncbi:hypothetical protein N9D15_03510 [Flavobacteriaceae bacterium]|jgi:hypothetical protein|nr:hypothetical protein [Flavobacteriaceae bacterium]